MRLKKQAIWIIALVALVSIPPDAVHGSDVALMLAGDVGYMLQYASSVYAQNDNATVEPDSVTTNGSGNSRVGVDLTFNLGSQKRFGLGASYRRINPDLAASYNGYGLNVAWTNVADSGSVGAIVSSLVFSAGIASINFDDEVYSLVGADFGSGGGGYGEAQIRVALPVFDVTKLGQSRRFAIAPYVSLSAGGVVAARDVESATLTPIDGESWYLGAATWYTTVNLGVIALLKTAEE